MLKALIALVAAAMVAGASLYILLAQLPERTQGQTKRDGGTPILFQAGLALLSLILGIWAWWKTGDLGLLIGGLLIGAAVPLMWSRFLALRTLLVVGALISYFVAFLWP
ncbi:MAG TPA: hypothetical protein VFO69_09805 [Allosphingosinicella sp.]|nr:hypothetical protein [Allosphingosinicella sp.]